jgi:hypothetical protein
MGIEPLPRRSERHWPPRLSPEPVATQKAGSDRIEPDAYVRTGWRKEWIKHDPDWSTLRGLREFAALVS